MLRRDWLRLHPMDNLIVALRDLPAGTLLHIDGQTVQLRQTVHAKHKFTLDPTPAGTSLYMYGVTVGTPIVSLPEGSVITTANTVHATQPYTATFRPPSWSPPDVSHLQHLRFQGYHRHDGQVGTANHWLIIPLVFCENRNVEVLKIALLEPWATPLPHPSRHSPVSSSVLPGGRGRRCKVRGGTFESTGCPHR